jgi:hypothetical protein
MAPNPRVVLNAVRVSLIPEEAIWRRFVEILLDKKTIGRQLQHIGRIGLRRSTARLHLHGNEVIPLSDNVVGLAGQQVTTGE